MRNRSKLILVALAATALLGLAVADASANRLSTTEKNFELIWNPNLGAPKTPLIFGAGTSTRISCNVTLLGRFAASTIAKSTGINQGTINHGELEGCRGGTATIRTETMPWNLRYRSFGGTLPSRISEISTGLIGAKFAVTASGFTCEPITEVEHPGVGILESISGGVTNNIRADPTARIQPTGFFCEIAGEEFFEGIGLVRNLPRNAQITVSLI